MKFVHLSDLHLGKMVNGFSMIEEQSDILMKILHIIDEEKPEGVFLAGDIYDKSIPPIEAVKLFDDFLNRLAKRGLQVFVVSGNHDSPERLGFASALIEKSGIYLTQAYHGKIQSITLKDTYGKVVVHMLPFIKPVQVRSLFPEEAIETYTEAVKKTIEQIEIDEKERNILITHQFVTGAECAGSEEIFVGGIHLVDASVFDAFDYVALGHIHRAQYVGRESIRYCGTPLKYSFAEINNQKSVTIVELGEKGKVSVCTAALVPRHDMRALRGAYQELADKRNYEGTAVDDYLYITLTDEEDVIDAAAKLRVIYPNLMQLDYDNKRTREGSMITEAQDTEMKTPLALLQEFYEQQNHQPMNEEQNAFAAALAEEIWG